MSDIMPNYIIFTHVLDIVLVYLIIYKLLSWLKITHALDLIKGLLLIFLIFLGSHILDLTILNWILEKFSAVILILMVVIFQPELRRVLEKIGSSGNPLFTFSNPQPTSFIHKLIRAVDFLSREKIGAIIAIEGQKSLEEYVDTGIAVKGDLNAEILTSLFWPGSPTHDGAVIIKDGQISAAGCFLPLTDTPIKDRRLGTRHRAAIGLSELSDSIVIVISEESGVISLVEEGNMTRFLTKEALETRLFSLFSKPDYVNKSYWNSFNLLKLLKKG